MSSNYSFKTSLPAYDKGSAERLRQKAIVKAQIKLLRENACIRLIAANTGIPDSTVSGRIDELKKSGEVEYYTKGKVSGRVRKLLRVIEPIQTESQTKLFQ